MECDSWLKKNNNKDIEYEKIKNEEIEYEEIEDQFCLRPLTTIL